MSVSTEQKRKEGGFSETVRVIIHALIIAAVIRTFLFQPFNIPSGSMKATLLIGDYLFVSMATATTRCPIRRHCFPDGSSRPHHSAAT